MPVSPAPPPAPTSSLTELKHRKVAELAALARDLGIEAAGAMKKQDLIFAILQAESKKADEKKEEMEVASEGTIEVLPDGFGFLRSADFSYLPGPDDIYVSPSQNPPIQPADRRLAAGNGAPAQGGRAVLRPPAGGLDQRRASRGGTGQGPLRQPHPPLSHRAPPPRARPQRDDHAGRGPLRPHRQGAALPHRLPSAGRQDRAAAAHRPRHHRQPSGGDPHRPAHRRAARGGHRHGTDGEGRGGGLHLRRAGHPSRPGGRDGHREGPEAGGAQEGRGHPPRLDHPAGARLQLHGPLVGQDSLRRRGRQRPPQAQALLRGGPQHRGGRDR